MEKMRGIYKKLCLNCGGSISDERLLQLGICESCLEDIRKFRNLTQVLKELGERGKLKFAGPILNFQERLKDFSNFFKKLIGHRMWSLQETWARRILLGKNFSIVALNIRGWLEQFEGLFLRGIKALILFSPSQYYRSQLSGELHL